MEYGLIGEHLSDSFTKFIHERIASYFSNKCSDYKDYKYEVHELRAEQVKEYLHASRFKGINVAAPYQQTVIPYLDEISDQAREIGAVDTIINRGGRLCGGCRGGGPAVAGRGRRHLSGHVVLYAGAAQIGVPASFVFA